MNDSNSEFVEKSAFCPQCECLLKPSFKYCPNCGQKKIGQKESLKELGSSFLGDYFTFDSKLMASLRPLIGKPGFLTQAYIDGKRSLYISPLRLYIFISIVFFLVLNLGSHSSNIGESGRKWDAFFNNYMPKIFFLLVPFFALLSSILFRKDGHGIVIQLVGALHYHAFIFLTLIGYLLLSKLLAWMGAYTINSVLLGLLGVWFLVYLFRACRRLSAFRGWALVWRYILLWIIYIGVVLAVTLLVFAAFTMSIS